MGDVLKGEEGLQTVKNLGPYTVWVLKKLAEPKKE
jgi:hypothetical protein